MVNCFALQSLQFAQHLKAASAQSQTLFGVLDYGSSRNCIESGGGEGLTRATDSCVIKLMLMHDSSLLLGVAATHPTHGNVIVAGVAGIVAGAMSMAAGEYVSVKSQADAEKAELARKSVELT
jgi:hypothetical protein